MIKCVGYARVSSLSTEQQNSFLSQKKYFEQYCKDKGYELIQVFSDEGISGTSMRNRDGLKSMLSQCGVIADENNNLSVVKCKAPFDIILISNTSRLGRSLTDVRKIIECLRENNVYVHFIDNNIKTDDTSSDFLLSLLQLMDEQYSKDLSSKVKNGFIKSVAVNNKIHTNNRLYGYRYENGKLYAIEDEVSTIKLIYDLYEQGYGFRRVSNELESRGIRTRQGKRFGKTTLMNILTQAKYCGINNRLRYTKEFGSKSTTPIKREGAEQYYKTNEDIPQIISKEQFERVQVILASKAGDRKGVNPGQSLWSGKIKCSKCGSSYTSNRDRGDRQYYNCSGKRKYGTEYCDNKNISLSKLNENLTSEWLISSLESIKLMQKVYIRRSIEELEASKNISHTEEVKSLKLELQVLEEQRDKLLDIFLEGILDKESYTMKKTKLDNQIEDMNKQIQELSRSNNAIDAIIQSKYNLIENINKLKVERYYTQEQIIDYIDTIIIEGNLMHIKLNILGEVLEIAESVSF